jgi:hypothetical protein
LFSISDKDGLTKFDDAYALQRYVQPLCIWTLNADQKKSILDFRAIEILYAAESSTSEVESLKTPSAQ